MRIAIGHGHVMITLPEAVLVLTKTEFIEVFRRGKVCRQRALERRQATRHGGAPYEAGHG
jgi:hypothetical protein